MKNCCRAFEKKIQNRNNDRPSAVTTKDVYYEKARVSPVERAARNNSSCPLEGTGTNGLDLRLYQWAQEDNATAALYAQGFSERLAQRCLFFSFFCVYERAV